MRKFRKWIARFLKITNEDLPENSRTNYLLEQINKRIHEEVRNQLQQQLQISIHDVILPETTATISKQVSESIQRIIDQIGNISNSDHLSEYDNPEKIILNIDGLEKKPTLDVVLDEDFPIIDESELKPEISDTSDNNFKLTEDEEKLSDPSTSFSETEIDQPKNVSLKEEEIIPLKEPLSTPIIEVQSKPLIAISEKEIRIGIDFGTSTTAISIKIGDDRPIALPIGSDGTTRYIPSIVYIKPGAQKLTERAVVGEEAESYGDQDHIIRSVKRCFGCQGGNCHEFNNGSYGLSKYPFPWCQGDGKIHISENEVLDPPQIAYLIVREILIRAKKVVRERFQIDLNTENVCFLPLNLGCGATFNLNQRELICSIAKEVGFQNIKLENVIEEPILAGFTFSRFAEQPEGRALIYDFGGGTFDVAVLDVDRHQNNLRVTVITTDGENWLGGDDIDTLVYNHFRQKAAEETNLSINEFEKKLGSIDKNRLHLLARRAKEDLSSANIYSSSILAENIGSINLDLTRSEFEEILEESGLIQKSLNAVERACRLAYVYENAKEGKTIDTPAIIRYKLSNAAHGIDRVILVGGVTKTPYVQEKLIRIFGRDKIVQEKVIDPISAVAIGGSYPRESQHYSICTPPFGFYMEYECSDTLEKKKLDIFYPYEHYDFHKFWAQGPTGNFSKEFDVPTKMNKVILYATRVGDQKPCWESNIGKIDAGTLQISVLLEGKITYSNNGGASREILDYPIIHPIQQAIRDSREARKEQERLSREQSQGDYDDQIRAMMSEN